MKLEQLFSLVQRRKTGQDLNVIFFGAVWNKLLRLFFLVLFHRGYLRRKLDLDLFLMVIELSETQTSWNHFRNFYCYPLPILIDLFYFEIPTLSAVKNSKPFNIKKKKKKNSFIFSFYNDAFLYLITSSHSSNINHQRSLLFSAIVIGIKSSAWVNWRLKFILLFPNYSSSLCVFEVSK